MPSAANVTVIVIRLITSVISFAMVGWFIVYLKRRMELQEITRKIFLLATIMLGVSSALIDIPGALMLSCISSEADTKNLVLSFFQTLFFAFTMYGQTIALYIRSCDIVDAKTKKIVRYLIILAFVSSFGVIISAFVLIFIPVNESGVEFDSVRCMVKNPAEIYLGIVIGTSVVAIDSIFIFNFVQYLRKTRKLLGNSPSDVLTLISQEAVKILVLNYIGFFGFALYQFIPGDVGTVFFLVFDICVLAGLFLWIRLKYWLDHRDSQKKHISRTTQNTNSLKISGNDGMDQNFSSTSQNPIKASHQSLEPYSSSMGNNSDRSRINESINQSFDDRDIITKSDQIP